MIPAFFTSILYGEGMYLIVINGECRSKLDAL